MTRYEMLDRIGVGGMAEIFRGRAVAGGGFEKPVAIKRILPHLSQDERFVKMLIAEANTLSQLRHRNIVQIFDVGLGDDGQYFLVMEYVPGSDLRTLYESLELRGKRLPQHLALHVVAEVCDALDFAHRATAPDGTALQLVHRDVSPSNVLLSQNGEVKLTDFGIAKRVEEVTGHYGVRGKFAYISPEQARNESVDGRGDVFSLGIVLYELATGRRLFSGMSDFDALHAVRTGAIPRPRERDPAMRADLERIVQRALAHDPDQRYQSAADFGSALREYRYSVLTTAGDPASELARILEALTGPPEEDDEFHHEPTVLRIHTAAGFTGIGMEQRIASNGGFEEEKTRAMSGEQIRELIEEGVEPTQDVAIDQLLEVAPLAEAETRMLDTRGRIPSPTGATPTSLMEEQVTVPRRAATPTVRDVFHRGEMLDRSRPDQHDVETEYVSRYEEEYFGIPRRKAIIMATVLAAALAVAAFVVAGALLSDDGVPAIAPSADATEPAVELPRDEIETGSDLMAAPVEPDAAPPEPKKKRDKKTRNNKKKKRKGSSRKDR